MKKYLQAIPIILFPYIFVVLLIIAVCINIDVETVKTIFFSIMIAYTVLLIYFTISKMESKEMVNVNLAIKLFQLPWYILSFILEIICFITGIFGVIITALFIIINLYVRCIAGLYSIGCVIKLKKNKNIGIPKTIFYSIGSFIVVFDFIVAIIMNFDINKVKKEVNVKEKVNS